MLYHHRLFLVDYRQHYQMFKLLFLLALVPSALLYLESIIASCLAPLFGITIGLNVVYVNISILTSHMGVVKRSSCVSAYSSCTLLGLKLRELCRFREA